MRDIQTERDVRDNRGFWTGVALLTANTALFGFDLVWRHWLFLAANTVGVGLAIFGLERNHRTARTLGKIEATEECIRMVNIVRTAPTARLM